MPRIKFIIVFFVVLNYSWPQLSYGQTPRVNAVSNSEAPAAEDAPTKISETLDMPDDTDDDYYLTVERALNSIEENSGDHENMLHPQNQLAANNTIDVLEVKNMDIYDVLELIAIKSGLNIIAGEDIEGKVTIYLKHVDVRDALRIILDANNLAYSETVPSAARGSETVPSAARGSETVPSAARGSPAVAEGAREQRNIIRVMKAEEFESKFGYPFRQKIQTKIIPLLYAEASDINEILNKMKSDSGKIIYNEETKTFVLMDAPGVLASMVAVIKELDVFLETKKFELQYAQAQGIVENIQEVLTKSVGRVQINSRLNNMIITDTPSKILEISKLLERLDQEDKEILIEAKILQIMLNDEYAMGVDWEAIVTDYQSLNLVWTRNTQASEDDSGRHDFNSRTNSLDIGNRGLSLGTISEEDYIVLLEALDTVGVVSTVSNAKLITANNKVSALNVKSLLSRRLENTLSDGENSNEVSELSETSENEEVKFNLTPSMSDDDTFSVSIQPEQISLENELGMEEKDSDNPSSNFAKKTAREEQITIVKIQNGSTIVIGGLFEDITVESTRKIPLLGDLPLLGFAFRNQGESIRKSEIIVFLTPKLVEKK
jgi:type II secretory pathway component GspD/PulD (secretin)